MPQKCSVCIHPERAEIDKALVARVSLRTIADQYGLSKTALIRHKASHMAAAVVAARASEEAVQIRQGLTLDEQLHSLQARTLAILASAEADGKLHTCLAAIREVRMNTELEVKIMMASGRQTNPFTEAIIENYRRRKAAAGPMVRRTQLKPYVPEETEEEQAEDALQPSPWEESKDPPAPPAEAAPPATIRQRDLAAEQQQYLRNREDEEG